mmetsp:Transcript_38824/g.93849  ORF Transcript_38824/g.93849 Transcript_38824/m.93849 type:complete len:326 (+) Transcript_38824:1092-2069(+)
MQHLYTFHRDQGRVSTSGDDSLFEIQRLAIDNNRSWGCEFGVSNEHFNSQLLAVSCSGVMVTDFRSNLSHPLHDFIKIDPNGTGVHKHPGLFHTRNIILQTMGHVGRMNECLGWNTSSVQTVTTEHVSFNHGHLSANTSRTASGNQSTDTSTNYHNIIHVAFSGLGVLPVWGMNIIQQRSVQFIHWPNFRNNVMILWINGGQLFLIEFWLQDLVAITTNRAKEIGPFDCLTSSFIKVHRSSLISFHETVKQGLVRELMVSSDVLEEMHSLKRLANTDSFLSVTGTSRLHEKVDGFTSNETLRICFHVVFSILDNHILLEGSGKFA